MSSAPRPSGDRTSAPGRPSFHAPYAASGNASATPAGMARLSKPKARICAPFVADTVQARSRGRLRSDPLDGATSTHRRSMPSTVDVSTVTVGGPSAGAATGTAAGVAAAGAAAGVATAGVATAGVAAAGVAPTAGLAAAASGADQAHEADEGDPGNDRREQGRATFGRARSRPGRTCPPARRQQTTRRDPDASTRARICRRASARRSPSPRAGGRARPLPSSASVWVQRSSPTWSTTTTSRLGT